MVMAIHYMGENLILNIHNMDQYVTMQKWVHPRLVKLTGLAGTRHFPLLTDGLLSGGGALCLQFPEDLSLDH